MTPKRAFQKHLFVDDHVEGAAHVGVLERFEGVVQVHEIPVQREPFDHLQRRVVLDFLRAVGGDVVDHVQFTRPEAGQPHRRFGDLACRDAVQIGGAVPVVVETGQFDLVAEFAADEFEWTTANGRFALHVAGS